MFWLGIEADIKDYTRRCQVCIKRSRPAREPLQPHEIPDGPWQKLGMDFFDLKGEPVTVDHAKVKAVLIGGQIKDSQQYNKSHRVKSQRTLVLGERCWGTGTNNEWLDCYITGIDKENRCYWVVFEDTGRRLRRTRSHLRPRGPDFPHISERFLQQNAASSENSVLSAGEGENEANNQEISVLSGPPLNSEQDTAVDFISDAPSERAVTFNDNPVAGTRYIPLRL